MRTRFDVMFRLMPANTPQRAARSDMPLPDELRLRARATRVDAADVYLRHYDDTRLFAPMLRLHGFTLRTLSPPMLLSLH